MQLPSIRRETTCSENPLLGITNSDIQKGPARHGKTPFWGAILDVKNEVADVALDMMQQDFDAAPQSDIENPDSWIHAYRRAKERALDAIGSDERIKLAWELDKITSTASNEGDIGEFDASRYLRLDHFLSEKSLFWKIEEMTQKGLEAVFKNRGITVAPSGIVPSMIHLMQAACGKESALLYLRSQEVQIQHFNLESMESDILVELAKPFFSERLKNANFDWDQAKKWGEENEDRQRLEETFAGTLSYLLDAGIVTKRTKVTAAGHEEETFTLTPAIIAPLMTSAANGTGESGFQLLSRFRAGGALAISELTKEAAQIIFTSATIGLGKLMMGAG